jgi:hypothetical protein
MLVALLAAALVSSPMHALVPTGVPAIAGDPLAPNIDNTSADVSIGAGLSWPEIALIYASVFPGSNVSIDGMFTLSTIDAGLTYHAPLGGRNFLLAQALVGWVHAVRESDDFAYKGVRFFGGVGYGALASWDFRAVIGYSAEQIASNEWGYTPAAFLTLGKVF